MGFRPRAVSGVTVERGFAPGSDKGKTRAKPEIWDNKADFEEKLGNFECKQKLAEVAASPVIDKPLPDSSAKQVVLVRPATTTTSLAAISTSKPLGVSFWSLVASLVSFQPYWRTPLPASSEVFEHALENTGRCESAPLLSH